MSGEINRLFTGQKPLRRVIEYLAERFPNCSDKSAAHDRALRLQLKVGAAGLLRIAGGGSADEVDFTADAMTVGLGDLRTMLKVFPIIARQYAHDSRTTAQ